MSWHPASGVWPRCGRGRRCARLGRVVVSQAPSAREGTAHSADWVPADGA